MAKKKRGRPAWEPTPEILEKVQKFAALGLTQEQISHNIDIHPATFSEKVGQFNELSDAIKKGKAQGIAFVTNKLMEHVRNGNVPSTMFWLKCQAHWKENDPSTLAVQPLVIKVDGKLVEMT